MRRMIAEIQRKNVNAIANPNNNTSDLQVEHTASAERLTEADTGSSPSYRDLTSMNYTSKPSKLKRSKAPILLREPYFDRLIDAPGSNYVDQFLHFCSTS